MFQKIVINFKKAFVLFLFISSSAFSQELLDLDVHPAITSGEYTAYFSEAYSPYTLGQAINHFETEPVRVGANQSISLGIDVAPVWLKTKLFISESTEIPYRFSVETPWLDKIDAWLVHNGKVIQHVTGGDSFAYEDRPMQYRYFAFESNLPIGETQLYMRVESVGPMAIPVRISQAPLAIKRDISSAYQYGLLYGLMVALAIYNLILYFSIRKPEYGLYAIYLIGFVLNSLSYTGQLHTWITPNWGAYFQDWLDIFLMITYSIAGLHFARLLLKTREYAPKLDKATVGITLIIPLGMLVGALFNNLTFSLILAFTLNTSFAVLFVVMGYKALKNKVKVAKLFLLCSVTAATCIGISTAAVGGLLPYNDVTFKLIEVGMAFEAVCLAFILAQHFRQAELEKELALRSARIDALTGLNNRHGFEQAASPVWYQTVRRKRELSFILMDIDHFKVINDKYGHAQGDEVLKSVASLLEYGLRKSDICARWGGEEFLILLPDTNEEQAAKHAERLRCLLEEAEIDTQAGIINVSASFGVCGTSSRKWEGKNLKEDDLEKMIDTADRALYKVKSSGRNQVHIASLLPAM